jgi:hypothetical protein
LAESTLVASTITPVSVLLAVMVQTAGVTPGTRIDGTGQQTHETPEPEQGWFVLVNE